MNMKNKGSANKLHARFL